MTFKRSYKPQKHPPALNILLHTLADDTRRIILEIMVHSCNEITIDYIQKRSYMSYHTIYHHLGIMEEAGLLESCRDGRERYYIINVSAVDTLSIWFSALSKILHTRQN